MLSRFSVTIIKMLCCRDHLHMEYLVLIIFFFVRQLDQIIS